MPAAPKPWRVIKNWNGAMFVADAEGRPVCDVSPAPPDVSSANAAAIALAPDLIAFVERLAEWRPCGLFGEIEDEVAGIRHDAIALIALARTKEVK